MEPAGITQTQLVTLLAGLNLADHVDDIGADTIPAPLMSAILTAFEANVSAKETTSPSEKPSGVAPTLWLPDEERLNIDKDTPAAELPAIEPVSTLATPSAAQLREELEEMVRRDLLGPAGGEDEELEDDRVYERYLLGALAPSSQTMPEEQDKLDIAESGSAEDGPADTDSAQKSSLNPSSIGLTFCVDLDAPGLMVTARWGHYQKQQSREIKTSKGAPQRVWKRTQRGGEAHFFSLREGPTEVWQPAPEEQPDVFVKGIMRRAADNWTVTLFLVNRQRR